MKPKRTIKKEITNSKETINMNRYSVSYTTKKADYAQPNPAYGHVQINEVMEQYTFSHHMATHSKYSYGNILQPAAAMTAVPSPDAVAQCTLMCSLSTLHLARRRG